MTSEHLDFNTLHVVFCIMGLCSLVLMLYVFKNIKNNGK